MYSMPQQAVTNGYWKMEFALAQPSVSDILCSNQLIASSRRVSRTGTTFSSPRRGSGRRADSGTLPSGRKMGSLPSANENLLRPLERALAPDVHETQRKGSHEGEHLHVSEPAE